jgi:hypothetical protein
LKGCDNEMNDREILELLLQKVTNIETDVAVIKTDVAILQSDVILIKSDVALIKSDVALIKSDVVLLQSDVAILQTDVSLIQSNYKNLAQKVDIILEQTARLTESQDVTASKLNQMSEDQISIKEIIGDQMVSIHTLKRNMFFSLTDRVKEQTS